MIRSSGTDEPPSRPEEQGHCEPEGPAPVENAALAARMSEWLARSQERIDPYEVVVLGTSFLVRPGVFSPGYYSETEFYARELLRTIRPGLRLLDVGCGVGVNAVLAALAGAQVTAVDLNPAAVGNTRDNLQRHGIAQAADVRVSDVFSAVDATEMFDVIYWNVPFAYRPGGTSLTVLEEAIFDPGFVKQSSFISGAREHLGEGGFVLMGVSPSLGDVSRVRAVAAREGLTVRLVAEELERDNDEPTLLQLLRLTPIAEQHHPPG